MINEIPKNIGDYLEYDESSSTFLRWKKLLSIKCRRINVGDEAGYLDKRGYYQTGFNRKSYLNHRIIFFLHHRHCPDCIDHVDGVTTNNKIDNLREASLSENNHNRKINKNNKTKVKGLSTDREKYWRLQIKKNGKCVFLERYLKTDKTEDECRIVLENKRKELHGKFSNHG